MTPIYITCFNAPELCRNVIVKLTELGHAKRHELIISDQSDEGFQPVYRAMSIEFGCTYVHHENKGASGSKRSVLRHAKQHGYTIVHQMSEDFIIGDSVPWLPSGVGTFLEDSEAILTLFSELSFVKWNLHTGHNGDMSYIKRGTAWFGGLSIRAIQGINLMFAVGSVQYSNWPATWRVADVASIWEAASTWVAPNEEEAAISKGSNGEWAASHCGVGKGAVLIANPMRHPERVRPEGSLP